MSSAQQRDERYFVASSWTLMRRSFVRHRLALGGGVVLTVIYLLAIFADFVAVSGRDRRYPEHLYAPPPGCEWCTRAVCGRRSSTGCR